jgi:hypothetical protein
MSDNMGNIAYRDFGRTIIFVYQMLLGDTSHDGFMDFKQSQNGSYTWVLLYIVYVFATLSIVLVLMNIIIAIMGEVQGQRGEKGRAVIYAT